MSKEKRKGWRNALWKLRKRLEKTVCKGRRQKIALSSVDARETTTTDGGQWARGKDLHEKLSRIAPGPTMRL